MTEINLKHEPKPNNPNLLRCQFEMKKLCDEILSQRPKDSPYTFFEIEPKINPNTVSNILKESDINDLLLKDGDTLSITDTNDYFPDINLFVGDTPIKAVSLRAWGWKLEKNNWMRQLDIGLHYSDDIQTATQLISIHTSSNRSGELPFITRSIHAAEYAETGYEGHSAVGRQVSNENEAIQFIRLAEVLFDSRKNDI
ncbi:MAG: hypothetical protein WCK26_02845 [Candidatus Saccharibacteria bacterium]